MWNFVNTIGMNNTATILGPIQIQKKRNLAIFNLANVAIAPGKCFTNPNYVNRQHPNVCQIDNKFNIKSNSSQDNLKLSDENVNKKNRNKRRNRRKRKRRNTRKNHIKNNLTTTMNDTTNDDNDVPMQETPQQQQPPPPPSSSPLKHSPPPQPTTTTATFSFGLPNLWCRHQRRVSLAESEDSFIIFDSGNEEDDDVEESTEIESNDDDSEFEFSELESINSVLPAKKVRFAEDKNLCVVHPMIKWSFAYRQARLGPWENYARDRDRFKKRICTTEKLLLPIFDLEHRENVFRQRFQDLGKETF